MSDHHLAQERPALDSALQDKLSRLWDAVRASAIPDLIALVERLRADLAKFRARSEVPEVSRPIVLIRGKINRGPSDGRSVIVVAADSGYTWEIRRYGSPVSPQDGTQSFDKADEAWHAGLMALDRHRAAQPGSSAS